MTFGSRMREFRTGLNQSQAIIASKTGIPQTTISDWENDKSEPTVSDIMKLSSALGVSISKLLAENEDLDSTEHKAS